MDVDMGRSASQIWHSFDIGPNFMTPEVIEWGFVGDEYVYELSKGTGFVGEEIIGVSFRPIDGGGSNDGWSREWSDMVISLEAGHELIELARIAVGKVSHG